MGRPTCLKVVMIRPEKPGWETSIQRVGSVALAIPLAATAALIAWKFSVWRVLGRTLGYSFLALTFFVFLFVIYSGLLWYWKRPAELARRLPTDGKELRRKRKAFYDWLALQGRRR